MIIKNSMCSQRKRMNQLAKMIKIKMIKAWTLLRKKSEDRNKFKQLRRLTVASRTS